MNRRMVYWKNAYRIPNPEDRVRFSAGVRNTDECSKAGELDSKPDWVDSISTVCANWKDTQVD